MCRIRKKEKKRKSVLSQWKNRHRCIVFSYMSLFGRWWVSIWMDNKETASIHIYFLMWKRIIVNVLCEKAHCNCLTATFQVQLITSRAVNAPWICLITLLTLMMSHLWWLSPTIHHTHTPMGLLSFCKLITLPPVTALSLQKSHCDKSWHLDGIVCPHKKHIC